MSNEISNLFFECIKKLNKTPFKVVILGNKPSSTIYTGKAPIWGYLGVDRV